MDVRPRPWLWVAVLSGVMTASGAVLLEQDAQTTPAVAGPPVSLADGSRGTLDTGLSGTAGSVTYSALGLTTGNITQIVGGDQAWDIHLELQRASGVGALDSFTLSLCRSSCTTQIVIQTGTTTKTSGAAVTLPAGATDLYVGISDTKASFRNTAFTTQLVLEPSAGSGSHIRYDYAVTITI